LRVLPGSILESSSAVDSTESSRVFSPVIYESSSAFDAVLSRFLWELINDSQTVTWQLINSANYLYSNVATFAGLTFSGDSFAGTGSTQTLPPPDWQNINSSQIVTWTLINDANYIYYTSATFSGGPFSDDSFSGSGYAAGVPSPSWQNIDSSQTQVWNIIPTNA
jgi:hypothetical protein